MFPGATLGTLHSSHGTDAEVHLSFPEALITLANISSDTNWENIYLTQEEKRLHLERQGMQSQAIRLTKDKLGIPCYVSGRSSDRRNDDFLSHTFLNTSVFEY